MVDPKKMQAWAGKGEHGPRPGPQDGHEDNDMAEPDDAADDAQDDGAGKGELVAALDQFAQEAEECAEELDGDALTDPDVQLSDEDRQILEEGLDGLPPRLRKVLEQHARGISLEDAQDVAEQLADADKIQDPDRLAGWLYQVGQVL